ncbi:MAG: hydantoinase/oxoprolinase family protein [Anaerolineae bacterium]|nr:hydantoinase/oxoprolinase family protein [Anaerolineae bacterium]
MSRETRLRIGADVGGTFTDVVILDDAGHVWTDKVLSTPPEFEQAVLQSVARLLARLEADGQAVTEVAHGTTVATNAVLEHRGALTALITTRGFRDVLELRRIRAPQMYDLFWEKPRPLVERYLRFELTERLSATGEVVTPLNRDDLAQICARLQQAGVESVAVCLIHAYANPEHEQIVGNTLAECLPGVQVSLSHQVLRERKEYERTATTVVNAYVRPVMQHYVGALREGLNEQGVDAPLLIMQSAGGLTPAEDAAVRPVYVLESGPAAGVLAALALVQRQGLSNAITLDVGGTTAKASIIEDGQIAYSPEYEVGASLSAGNRLVGGGGELIRAPSIDIAEVGAGGGSIAWLDPAGGLRVGPQSAGARPGPVCYGRGGQAPTVTDANVVLGYIRPGRLADGSVSVDLDAARRAVHDQVAHPLGLDLLHAADGIHRIANARTMRALRAVSTERGRDPRDFTLVAFGGAGPIHAASLARELGVRRVVIPPLPGLFSALGLLFSGVEHHDVRSCRLSGDALTEAALAALRADMEHGMLAQFAAEGFPADQVKLSAYADVRFLGQASEIRLPLEDGRPRTDDRGRTTEDGGGRTKDELPTTDYRLLTTLHGAFLAEHERLYGHRSDPDNPIEVVAVRLIGRAGAPDAQTLFRPVHRPPSAVRRSSGLLRSALGSGGHACPDPRRPHSRD